MRTAILVLALTTTVAGTATAQQPYGASAYGRGAYDAPSMTLYSGPNFTGRSITVTGTQKDFAGLGFNDMAMSLRVRGTWKICENRDYGARCEWVDADVRDLGWLDLNRKISSVAVSDARPDEGGPYGYPRPVPLPQPTYPGGGAYDPGPYRPGPQPLPPRGDGYPGGYGDPYTDYPHSETRGPYGRLVFFSGPNYTGRRLDITEAVTDFNGVGFNDVAMSVRVEGIWSVCKDRDYRNLCVVVSRDIPDLRSDLSRALSSARPVIY